MSKPIPAKAIIVNSGRTMSEIALRVGVDPNTFRLVLNGQRASWPALRKRLAKVLRRSQADLFETPSTVDDAVAALVRISTALSGVPEKVEDAEALRAVGRALRPAVERLTNANGTKAKPAKKKTTKATS